jgi:RNA polymerase sigma-70 factor (ECF subfamily)
VAGDGRRVPFPETATIIRTFPRRGPSKQVERDTSSGERAIEPNVTQGPQQEKADARLAAAGDQKAFERLYRLHQGRVFSLSLRMAGPQWAEDLTQEVFIRAWRKLETFRGDAAFGTWLYRLAVNLILSRRESLRKREQRHGGDGEMLERIPARGKPAGLALDFEAAIGTLPEGARQVFVLYEIEGYPHAEIAEMMGISTGTSKSQLHRARMILREYLN